MGLRIGLANPNLNPNSNPNQVRGWQADFAAGTLRLPAAVRAWLRERVSSAAVDDTLTMHTMRTVHARCGYLLDPHTAVGVAAAQQYLDNGGGGGGGGPVACMGCAHPMKFLPTVAAAFGCSPEQAFQMASGAPGHRSNLTLTLALALTLTLTLTLTLSRRARPSLRRGGRPHRTQGARGLPERRLGAPRLLRRAAQERRLGGGVDRRRTRQGRSAECAGGAAEPALMPARISP